MYIITQEGLDKKMIYFIRHGETEENRSFRLQGRKEIPMNANGIAQAKSAGKWFRDHHIVFTHVFSSPSGRAVQTAQLAAPGIAIQTDERLLEMDYGPYEGADLMNPSAELQAFFADFVHQPAPQGMEQLTDVVRRTGAFLEEVRNLSGTILVSTHAIALKGCLKYLNPSSNGSYWSTAIHNCAIYAADVQNGRFGLPVCIRP